MCSDLILHQPDADTLFSFGGAQPFVPLYAAILGDGGHIFMNIICTVALWFVSSIRPITILKVDDY